MVTSSNVQIKVDMAFPRAGVVFAVAVDTPEGGTDSQAPTFHLRVTDTAGERTIPFNPVASAQLADWVRGYTRWLRRSNVTASHDDHSVTGSFDDGLTPEQIRQGVRDACDMIRQRFEPYSQSVLV